MSADITDTYQLLDAGEELKLEQIGSYRVVRQAAQAHWPKRLSKAEWDRVDAIHHRANTGGGHWEFRKQPPESFPIVYGDLGFHIKLTDFGHIGLFPEQESNWQWIRRQSGVNEPRVLNLFGYTGGSSQAAAAGGGQVTHVDASKGVVSWARENMAIRGREELPVRWIVEDVAKYIQREKNRGSTYQGLILDPPSFGRGPRGQVWKIETDLVPLMYQIKKIMGPLQFVLLSCHTPGYSPLCLTNVLCRVFNLDPAEVECGEMTVPTADTGLVLPSGTWARWPQ